MNEDNLFRILAVLIFFTGAVISLYHRRKADRESDERISLQKEKPYIRIGLRLSGMALWLGVFAYLIQPTWMEWSKLDLPLRARWTGTGMGVGATLLALWVFRSLGNNVTPTVVTRTNATLVTHGPYRWVRHPLYTMGTLAYLGFALLAENWFIALLTVVGLILLMLRTPTEEAHLVEKFGEEYRIYMQRTGRYLPKLN